MASVVNACSCAAIRNHTISLFRLPMSAMPRSLSHQLLVFALGIVHKPVLSSLHPCSHPLLLLLWLLLLLILLLLLLIIVFVAVVAVVTRIY